MAVARLSVGIGKKGKAAPHALYIAREEKYAKTDDDLEKLEFKGHGNMPKWAQARPNFFWKMSDEHERKNGTTYREHVISLPRELTPRQRHELVSAWIEQEINDKHAYQYAIHNPPAMDGDEQPHVHLMFSERLRDGIEREPDLYFKRYNAKHPDRGGAKKANTPKLSADRKAELIEQRDRWEQLCNKHLELAGSDARINMKSLKEQGIEREPLNLTMKQIKSDRYESVYKDLKQAERSSKLATEDVEDLIDITAELKRLTQPSAAERAMNTANALFGNSMKLPKPKPQQSDLLQKDEAGRFASTPEPVTMQSRISNSDKDAAFLAHAIVYCHRMTKENKDELEHEDYYFDAEQQKELNELIGVLGDFRTRVGSIITLDTNNFYKDLERDIIKKINHSSEDIESSKELVQALDIALDPAAHRQRRDEQQNILEQQKAQIRASTASDNNEQVQTQIRSTMSRKP